MTTRSFLRLALAATLVLAPPSAVGAQSPQASLASPPSERPSLGWYDELTGGPDMLDVATTVAPISSIVRNIGGDRIRLRGIVPDATNSHTFEPRPSDAAQLANADVIIVNGLHLEEPTLDLAEAAKRAETPIVMLGDQTVGPDEWMFDFSFPESEGDPNPHLWMNVPYAKEYATHTRDALAAADPANADYFTANHDRFQAALDDLDARIRIGRADRAGGSPQVAHLPRLVGLLGARVRLHRHRRGAGIRLLRPQPAGRGPAHRPGPGGAACRPCSARRSSPVPCWSRSPRRRARCSWTSCATTTRRARSAARSTRTWACSSGT